MTLPIQSQQSIGSIAVQIPGATAIFRKLKLDFCCGGQQPLAKACADKGLDTELVIQAIQALEHKAELTKAPTPGELIDHILQRYHEVHRQQLTELIRMARRVEAVEIGHGHVEGHHVGLELGRFLGAFASVGGLADNFDVFVTFKDGDERFAHHLVIVNDED